METTKWMSWEDARFELRRNDLEDRWVSAMRSNWRPSAVPEKCVFRLTDLGIDIEEPDRTWWSCALMGDHLAWELHVRKSSRRRG